MKGKKNTPVILSIDGDKPVKPIRNPQPPAHLGKFAREKWRKIMPLLSSLGTLTDNDLTLVEMFCACYENWRTAQKEYGKGGIVLKADEGGYYQSPWFSAANRMIEISTKLCSELGLSPTARAKIMGAERPSKRGKITRRNRQA
jgi:P27 family predicted phage terminase small subunit